MTSIPYLCSECGASGVKLWRQYNTFLDHQRLLCAVDAAEDQHVNADLIDNEGRYMSPEVHRRTDSIGWLVPAVPTDDGETFWGYSSIPESGVSWWRGLPNRK